MKTNLTDEQKKIYEDRGWKYRPSGTVHKLLCDENKNSFYARSFFDHHGVFHTPEGDIPFIEPYEEAIDWEGLVDFCRERDLRFSVSSLSPHFPGRTLMIKFFLKNRSRKYGVNMRQP